MKNSKLTALVDIDGTIADCGHRLHFIKNKPKNWKAFHKVAMDDEPIHEVLSVVKALKSCGYTIIMCTARDESNRELTVRWLKEVAQLDYDALYMRPDKDYRPDHEVKPDLYLKIVEDGYTPQIVFEDRKGVTESWRKLGLRVFQVAEGDY